MNIFTVVNKKFKTAHFFDKNVYFQVILCLIYKCRKM